MKKSDLYKRINRNSNALFNTNRIAPSAILSPDMYVDHLWLSDDDITTTGVQIVELKSSGSDKSGKSVNDDKDCWSFQNPNAAEKVNEIARERRRLRNQAQARTIVNDYSFDTSGGNSYDDEYIYADVYVSGSSEMPKDNVIYNHQSSCFTILDKHLIASDTSEEDYMYEDVEYLNSGEPLPDVSVDSNANEAAEIITYNPEVESEKRTVWIYSFKNKRLLSENEFELVNIPSRDASSSSIEDCKESKSQRHRIATPIPPPHVPRLHIPVTPTLPTVAEVTEPSKLSSSIQTDSSIKSREILGLKHNNWFLSERVTSTEDKPSKMDKSTSIVNWMALSPREKRRWIRKCSPIHLRSDLTNYLPTVKEVNSQEENNEKPTGGGDSYKVTEEAKDPEPSITEENMPSASNHSRQTVVEQTRNVIVDSARHSIRSMKCNNRSTAIDNANEIIIAESDYNSSTPEDRGDHKKSKMKKPRIQLSNKPVSGNNITDPLEKLDTSNWIYEDKLIEDSNIRRPVNAQGDSASDALWIRNMALLKPAEWTAYLPITESIPSLHLSLNTDSEPNRQSWFKRVTKVFLCCK